MPASTKQQPDSKQIYFPPKPTTEEGFKEPVSWLGGRELIASLKGMIIYALYGEAMDPRPWMKSNPYPSTINTANNESDLENAVLKSWGDAAKLYWTWKRERFSEWEKYLQHNPMPVVDENGDLTEFWFDYIADSGDGQMGVYGVGCLLLSDLWLTKDCSAESEVGSDVLFSPEDFNQGMPDETLLPRGSFLFVGGDTAYHVADYEALHERFQNPFRWAFTSIRTLMLRSFGPKQDAEKYFVRDGKPNPICTSPDSNNLTTKCETFDPHWDGTMSTNNPEAFSFWDTEPLRPIFGLPGNHDYYDDLDGFNRQFRRPPFTEVEENRKDAKYKDSVPLKIPTFQREQEASYTALCLPFGWWMLGIDSENKKLDFRQRVFFKELLEKWRPKKVIVATPEPTTVFGRQCDVEDKTAIYTTAITAPIGLKQPFLTGGELQPLDRAPDIPSLDGGDYCRLDLSGDTHHYSRYWGPEDRTHGQKEFASNNYASLVAGGGGAFFDSTATLIGNAQVTKNGKQTRVKGEVPPQTTFPSPSLSTSATAERIQDLWNIKKGGYVQTIGAVMASIIAFGVFFLAPIKGLVESLSSIDDLGDNSAILASLPLMGCLILFIAAWLLLSKLNERMKDARYKPGDIRNILRPASVALPLLLAAFGGLIYVFFILMPNWPRTGQSLQKVTPFIRDFLLGVQIVSAVVLLFVSNEYLNWLFLRFKLIQVKGASANSPTSSDAPAPIESNSKSNVVTTRMREFFSQLSLDKMPAFMIIIAAVLLLLFGSYLYGNGVFWETAADILFSVVLIGGFGGIVYLAVGTGGFYQKGVKKYFGFGILGIYHAFLQLLTTITLVKYGDWRLLIGVFVLSVLTNGLGPTGAFLNLLLGRAVSNESKMKRIIRIVTSTRFAAWIMKNGNGFIMLTVWLFYGTVILASPFVVRWFITPHTAKELIENLVHKYIGSTYEFWISGALLLTVAFVVGYRMSRLWFSWYLGVSLLFNGHNNEAGGGARIEGFKHILRIKVEESKLTVYVIGFDNAQINLEDLRPKLVDKFELECKTIIP